MPWHGRRLRHQPSWPLPRDLAVWCGASCRAMGAVGLDEALELTALMAQKCEWPRGRRAAARWLGSRRSFSRDVVAARGMSEYRVHASAVAGLDGCGREELACGTGEGGSAIQDPLGLVAAADRARDSDRGHVCVERLANEER